MGFVSCPNFSHHRCRGYTYYLALCWFCGLALGSIVILCAGDSILPLMRSAPVGAVSIVGSLYITVFPFLISAAAVYFSQSALLLVCFGKAFLLAYTAIGISRAYDHDGWLLVRLLLFSDWVLLPGLYFLWLRLLPGRRRMSGQELAAMMALAVLVGSVNYRIISPCLAVLMKI